MWTDFALPSEFLFYDDFSDHAAVTVSAIRAAEERILAGLLGREFGRCRSLGWRGQVHAECRDGDAMHHILVGEGQFDLFTSLDANFGGDELKGLCQHLDLA